MLPRMSFSGFIQEECKVKKDFRQRMNPFNKNPLKMTIHELGFIILCFLNKIFPQQAMGVLFGQAARLFRRIYAEKEGY
jgi:hypothetical protein